jgi:luciferase family oxidoreductase group 1
VLELQALLAPAAPRQAVRAIPGEGTKAPLWILGSSTFGAQLAAALGLPFAFASHFAPAQMMSAIEIYRTAFEPSEQLQKPYVMLGFNTFAAPSDEEGRLLASSMMQSFASLRRGEPKRLPPPDAAFEATLTDVERAQLAHVLACSAVGSPESVKRSIADFIARTDADELILASHIYDHAARVRAYEITAAVRAEMAR